jgi:tRNA (cmo5U34)-methyltransferase
MADAGRTGIIGEVAATPTAGWDDDEQVRWYLDRIDRLPPRLAGEQVLAEVLPAEPVRALDLGCGDGRLAALVLGARPSVTAVVAVDRSEPMLASARERFADDDRVEIATFDLNDPLGPLGRFDVVVSGFAIHHLAHERKRSLFAEIVATLRPGGVFANLEVVQCATPELHEEFNRRIDRPGGDPQDVLAEVEPQLAWMRDAGLVQVDCSWRWRGFALLVGQAP